MVLPYRSSIDLWAWMAVMNSLRQLLAVVGHSDCNFSVIYGLNAPWPIDYDSCFISGLSNPRVLARIF